MKNKKLFLTALLISIFLIIALFFISPSVSSPKKHTSWNFQSIDTMKYSRDLAREKLNDYSFDSEIDKQIRAISDTGATHIAIATPYDEEFYPMLIKWVAVARKYHLKVWLRGNWSGWEGWFEYPKITRLEHIKKTQEFIIKHQDLFEDGDAFSACPECENGGPGDPRRTGDIIGHRQFLIEEYNVTKSAFEKINKDVKSNFDSMNGDVAKAIMDKNTTLALDGVVVIDHYVANPENLISDIKYISKNSGGKIILGEIGVPIPDINGNLTEDQQAAWLNSAFSMLIKTPEVVGLSYWTNMGGSTALWKDDLTPKKSVGIIKSFYSPNK